MITSYNYEGKVYEEILESALKDLNESKEDLLITEETELSKIFKSKKIKLNIIKKEDIKNYIREYINTLSKSLNMDIKSEIKENDNIYSVVMISDNNSLLIGKDGKNLDAFQLLLRNSIKIQTNNQVKLSIDVANYKEQKNKFFEKEVKQIIEEVISTKMEVKMDSMNSYMRRIVHNVASKYENVETLSEGEEPNRYVTIKYKEN